MHFAASLSSAHVERSLSVTTRELRRLHPLLEAVGPQELCHLDDCRIEWLPPLRSIAQDSIPKAICDALEAMEPKGKRLGHIAIIHSWLMPRLYVQPWDIYRFSAIPAENGYVEFLKRTVSSMRFRDPFTVIAWNIRGSAVHACLMSADAEDHNGELDVVYLLSRTTHFLVALHCSKGRVPSRVQAALSAAGCGDIVFTSVPYDDLEGAFDYANHFLGIPAANRTPQQDLHFPVESRRQSMPRGYFEHSLPLGGTAEANVEAPASPVPFCCVECGQEFLSQEGVQQHSCVTNSAYSLTEYLCPHCYYTCFTWCDIQNHLATHIASGCFAS